MRIKSSYPPDCSCRRVAVVEDGSGPPFGRASGMIGPASIDKCERCKARDLPVEYASRGLVKVPRGLISRVERSAMFYVRKAPYFDVERSAMFYVRKAPYFDVEQGHEFVGVDLYIPRWLDELVRLDLGDEEAVRAIRRSIRDPEWGAALMTVARLGERAAVEHYIKETFKL